jgi:regulatory protein
MALRYVGKYATSRAKLVAYLARKVRERGWEEAESPDLDGIANRFSDLGYIDDAAYALSKSRELTSRGFGKRRLNEKLRLAGIDEEDSAAARDHADKEAVDAAVRYARRKKIGPFASEPADRVAREKAIGAMVRAGHDVDLARSIARLDPGAEVEPTLD